MKTFLQFLTESNFKGVNPRMDDLLGSSAETCLLQKGSGNPNLLPYPGNNLDIIDDTKWAIIFRKRYNVAQRKFAANYPDYRIKRSEESNLGQAKWVGSVFYKHQEQRIGTFSFSVYHLPNFPKPIAEIQWIGLYAKELDYKGDRIADWKHEQTEHRGVMTGIAKLFMNQVKDEISAVRLDDGSGGYWKHFFKKYYPHLTVFDI